MKKKKLFKIFKQISKSVLVLIGMLFLFSGQILCVQAAGGTLYHKHTDACYETVEIPCTEHYNYTEAVSETGFCPFCDKTTYMYAFNNIEYCSYTNVGILTYTVGVCQECGNIVYETPHKTFPAHTKEVTNLICGKTEETPIAYVSFLQSTFETTTNPVVLSINIEVLDEEFMLGDMQYSFDGGNTWDNNASRAFSENGTYTVVCKDVYGTMFQENFVIDCIVKPQPQPKPAPAPAPAKPIVEPEEQEVVEIEPIIEPKKEKVNSKIIPTSIPEPKEIITPFYKPKGLGIPMEKIRWTYSASKPDLYIRNLKENQIIEIEPRKKEVETSEEIKVVYRLAPIFVRSLYVIGCIFLFIAILGCVWYAYHNIVILYEVENKERFFIGVLIGTGEKERNVYISKKNMTKIGTKELLLTCFYYKKNKNIVVHTPLEKFRIKWEKEMRVYM